MPKNGVANMTAGVVNAGARGAKPWALGIQAGYAFDAWCKDQNIYIGYQTSREASGMNLPKTRWLAGYGVDVFGKNTNIGIEWDHDNAYNFVHGGTGKTSNLVSIRSTVKFG